MMEYHWVEDSGEIEEDSGEEAVNDQYQTTNRRGALLVGVCFDE
jgi:hypothetical protein